MQQCAPAYSCSSYKSAGCTAGKEGVSDIWWPLQRPLIRMILPAILSQAHATGQWPTSTLMRSLRSLWETALLFPLPSPDCSNLPLVTFLGYKPGQGVGSLRALYSAIDTVLPSFHDPSNLTQPSVNTTEISQDQYLFQTINTCITLFYLADCTDPLAGYAYLSNGSSHSKRGVKFKGCIRWQLLLPWMGLHSLSPPSPSALLLCCSNTAVGTRWEFMRKDDLFSQCMKKYRVHEKSRIFQVLFEKKEYLKKK